MKIVVIGGTGLIGNTLTGEGLPDALAGAGGAERRLVPAGPPIRSEIRYTDWPSRTGK
ncbi:hypothetical protein [Amycolatopsis sp. NPDC051903]|uniref:hypothetical protein n=1 Tax=Amycolatopsis sp. NPDC051903 TaxID=3363936 RepID=UPI0037A0FC1C